MFIFESNYFTKVTKLSKNKKTESANSIDAHVGQKIRMKRTLLGLSQDTLAKKIDLTFQQIQKYESGKNQVSSARLYQLAEILDTDINFFFEGFSGKYFPANDKGGYSFSGLAENTLAQPTFSVEDGVGSREILELVRSYQRIKASGLRKKVLDLVREFADISEDNMANN